MYIHSDQKLVSIKEIFDAILENGFEHLRGQWVDYGGYNTVTGACFLGQAAVNLDIEGASIQVALNSVIKVPYSKLPKFLRHPDFDYDYNTGRRKKFYPSMGLGSVLVGMNDRLGNNERYTYSWKQLVEYAHKHMEPYFNETVSVTRYDFGSKMRKDS